ncbi:hypothetical protein [Acuticoccus mangrovi]|uniref:Gluconate 2-dehydrogenase subunit 3 family protein n=1 Tax=Acuticoccus mangrovi TaxID=2796142 RepID=A0A934MCQ1_9HYPH|nr:hypothetical protein [Acuticoccus mangrovi]MBJ3775512.1 hypothetical protein [Acuticoccus mangrovi]
MAIAHKDPKLPPPEPIPEGPEWIEELGPFASVGETLAVLARTLCPHDSLPERCYRRVVRAQDRIAAETQALGVTVRDFCALLDSRMPLPFAELSESYRVNILKTLENEPAFIFLQRSTVRFLYDDVEVWEAFGYEGASVHLGGYIHRGFDDLDWLPNPPSGD